MHSNFALINLNLKLPFCSSFSLLLILLVTCIPQRHSSSCVSRYSVGQSTEGRQILGVRITGDVRHAPRLLMPSVKLVANIHGDEKVGRELLIGLAR